MQKRRCPSCGDVVPVLDKSIGTMISCPSCDSQFLAKGLCNRCGRPVAGGRCDCGGKYDTSANTRTAWDPEETRRRRMAQGLLVASLALAFMGIGLLLMQSGARMEAEALMRYAPADTAALVLADASDLGASPELQARMDELTEGLPSPERITSAAVFIVPAPRNTEGDPYILRTGGVARYEGTSATELASAAAELASPTVVGGHEGYSSDGFYMAPMADGLLFFGESSDALGTILEAYSRADGPPPALQNLHEKVEGSALRVVVVFDEQLREHGPGLLFDTNSEDLRQLALGVDVDESLALDIVIRLKNRTTAGKFASRLRKAAGGDGGDLTNVTVGSEGELVRVQATCTGDTAWERAQNIFRDFVEPPQVVYEEDAPGPPADTSIESSTNP